MADYAAIKASTTEKLSIENLLRQVRSFQKLPPAVIDGLAASLVCLRFAQGETIFVAGEPAAGLYLLQQGNVKISRVSLEGREYIMYLVEPGGTFNDVAAVDGRPNPATATAYSDVVVWWIARPDLQSLVQRYPELGWALAEELAGRARYLLSLVEDLAMRSVRGRLARLLLDEANNTGDNMVPRLVTQEEIAARLGTVREMVGRTLRSMAADHIIEFDRHRIVILDPERLAAEAEV